MTTTATTALRLGYAGSAGRWTGVLRDGSDVVIECGHDHANRASGRAPAVPCITALLYAAYSDYFAGQLLGTEGTREATARRLGARVEAGAFVAAARERIAAMRALTEGREVRDARRARLTEDGRRFNEYGLEITA